MDSGSFGNPHQQTSRPALLATLSVHPAESGNPSGSPDYLTHSTSVTLKAGALVLLIAGHVYAFCLGGTGILSQAGEWGVLIFLMVSGMGLTKSYGLEPCGRRFIRRRFFKISLPLWMTLALFYLLDYVLLDTTYAWHEIALSFAGIIPKAPPNPTLWFIPFILYLYGVFFLISHIRVPVHVKCILLGLASFGTTALITNVPLLSVYFGGWTTYTFAFPLSVCLMTYRHSWIEKLPSRFSSLLFICLLPLTGCFLFSPAAKTVFFAALVGVVAFCLDTVKSKSRIILFIGDHSYELYLLHFPFLASYGLVLGRKPMILFLALYCVLIFLLAVVLKKIGGLMNQLGENAGPHLSPSGRELDFSAAGCPPP